MALAAAVAGAAAAAPLSFPGAASAAADPQLVAAYGFDTAATATLDASGNGHTGTLEGAAWAAGGAFGGALSFDGTDDRVVVPGDSGLDLAAGFTLAAWVKPGGGDGWRTVLLRERGDGLAYGLYAGSEFGGPDAALNTGGSDVNLGTEGALPVGAWSHLAATYDPAVGLKLYVDGVLAAEVEEHGTPAADGAGDLSIGGNAVWGEYFQGLIDEVRVWDGPLAANAVALLPDSSVAPTAGARPRIAAPPRGTRVGGTVFVRATASGAPTAVQFLLDGAPLGAPVQYRFGVGYAVDWTAGGATAGWHALGARALYADGSSLDSAPFAVDVAAVDPTLLGAWGFNESGPAYDYSGRGNRATLNDVSTASPGEFRTGLRKNGELGSARVNDVPELSPGGALTVSAWVQPYTDLDGTQPLVVKRAWGGPIEYGLFAARDNGGVTGVITTDAGTFTVTAGDLNVGQPAHVSLTYDGAALRLFVEYTEVASVPAEGTVIDGTGQLSMLSAPGNGQYDEYLGVLDSVRVYNRALTAEQLASDNTPA
ncbi:hypothetical protein Val02_71120 [Virgisporangium aliadipatigenens]|uniref:LamG-like jellyroll fold domain-containing protein n=1 Tax=Virgisporangium aliadipatigenens TaxID=741659 RepID=A0A8J3YUU9_9ACTN|nr:LamG-like jellyroll fold domain-containing protein [Virgisporangium aliadipatigenens]GIJ50226.1 hypothetical protein Val02_71120 [Virgisporangium aliadipatigenens]